MWSRRSKKLLGIGDSKIQKLLGRQSWACCFSVGGSTDYIPKFLKHASRQALLAGSALSQCLSPCGFCTMRLIFVLLDSFMQVNCRFRQYPNHHTLCNCLHHRQAALCFFIASTFSLFSPQLQHRTSITRLRIRYLFFTSISAGFSTFSSGHKFTSTSCRFNPTTNHSHYTHRPAAVFYKPCGLFFYTHLDFASILHTAKNASIVER